MKLLYDIFQFQNVLCSKQVRIRDLFDKKSCFTWVDPHHLSPAFVLGSVWCHIPRVRHHRQKNKNTSGISLSYHEKSVPDIPLMQNGCLWNIKFAKETVKSFERYFLVQAFMEIY